MDDLPDNIQEEYLELISITAAKEEFQEQQHFGSSNCWAKMLSAFSKTSLFALKVLIPFSSTFSVKVVSRLLVIQSKARNWLDAEADMRCALSHTDPRIDLLVSKKANTSFSLKYMIESIESILVNKHFFVIALSAVINLLNVSASLKISTFSEGL